MIVIAIVAAALFLGYNYLKIEREKKILEQTLAGINRNLAKIDVDPGNYRLLREKLEQVVETKESLKFELKQLRLNLGQRDDSLDRTRVEIAVLAEKVKLLEEGRFGLEERITSLGRDKELLQRELFSVAKEKEELEVKFSSIKELKKAIRRIKFFTCQKRIDELKKIDVKNLLKGNKGYLIVNGESTMKPRVKIKVLPIDLPR